MTERFELLATMLATAALCGCDNRVADTQRPLVVAVSGDTDGRIVPCGCAANQSGGLPRRATYIEQLREDNEVIAADVGGAPSGNSLYQRLKFEAIARGEVAMHVDAHNIGAAEAALGAEYLRKMAKETGLPLVSANVVDAEGQRLAEPMRIVEAAGRKVALLGVLSESFASGDVQVLPPHQAILDALDAVPETCDSVVVLAYLGEDELIELAGTLPEVDLLLGGPTGQPIPPKRFGPTVLASATKEGKFIVELFAPSAGNSQHWEGRIVEMGEKFEDDSRQLENVRQFYAELARRDLTPQQTSFAAALPRELPKGYSVAGSESCRRCHEQEYLAFEASKHAAAWTSLQNKGAQVDPDCQRCHTTGYGLPGGFQSIGRSPRRVGVGCESCHGPSKGHAEDPLTHTTHYAAAANHCTGCHDRENSPKFDHDTYWSSISHGRQTTPDQNEPSEEE